MCGIVGKINFNHQEVKAEIITEMMQKIKHRGPDDEGIFIEDNVGLGFVRLSILDLSIAGHQPMQSSDSRYTLIFNGEVYNYIEIREELKALGHQFTSNTDTEVVLKSYEEWGRACLHKFNGMWAFVIYDKETKEVFGARDRFGVKPFYFYKDEKTFVFASEIKAIKSAITTISVNDQSVFDYLAFNRTDYEDRTFYNDVHKVPHGHCFVLNSNGEFKLEKWYDLENYCDKDPITAEEYAELLTSSVKLRMRSDVPVGVCLSGGLDSSAIASILVKKLNYSDITSFSAVYNKGQIGDEREFIDELNPFLHNMKYIKPTAESFFKEFRDYTYSLDEPLPSSSPYAQYKVMQLANQHAVVTLDGQGADEQLAGYHYFYGLYFKELLKKFSFRTLFSEIYDYTRLHKSLYGIKTLFFFLLPESLKMKLKVTKVSYIQNDFYEKHNDNNNVVISKFYGSPTLKKSLINHFEYKLEHLLKWADLNSMRFSIESRMPFLDYRLVEQTLSLPSDSFIKKGLTKYILRESMRNILPEKIRLRYDKIGFETPEDEWFREPFFKDIITDILNNPTDDLKKYINTTRAMEMYQNHLNKEINCSKDIWKWINLDLWLKGMK